jgi:acetoin utilization protein AcuB
MLVGDRMSRRVITIDAEQPVQEATCLLLRHRLRQLPVVRRGQLVGIISHRDLRAARPPIRTVAGAMTANPITIGPDAAIDEAARILRSYKIGGLPVVDRQRLVGIITVADVLDAFVALSGIGEGTVHFVVSGRAGRTAEARARRAVEHARGEVKWLHSASRRLQMRVKVKRADAVVAALEAAGFAVLHTKAAARAARPARARRALLP